MALFVNSVKPSFVGQNGLQDCADLDLPKVLSHFLKRQAWFRSKQMA